MAISVSDIRVKEKYQLSLQGKPKDARLKMVELLRRANLQRPASLIARCGSNEQKEFCDCGKSLRTLRHHCRQMLCPNCQRIKGFKLSKEVEGILTLLQTNAPGLKAYFLTLTLPACCEQDLQSLLLKLSEGFIKLVHQTPLQKSFIGGLRVIEVSFNRTTRMYLPHVHAILAVRASFLSKYYISQSQFLEYWRAITKCPDISQIKNKPIKASPQNSVASQAVEIVQYMLKPIVAEKWLPDSIAILNNATHRKRKYEFLGDFRTARKMIPKYKPACTCNECLAKAAIENK